MGLARRIGSGVASALAFAALAGCAPRLSDSGGAPLLEVPLRLLVYAPADNATMSGGVIAYHCLPEDPTDAPGLRMHVSFGDGSGSGYAGPDGHVYASEGRYFVVCSAADASGALVGSIGTEVNIE